MICLMNTFTLILLLLPSENCTPVGLQQLELEQKLETINHGTEMECSIQKVVVNPQIELQKNNWQSMISSYTLFKGYTDGIKGKIQAHQSQQGVRRSHLEPMYDSAKALVTCYLLLSHVFGVPGNLDQNSIRTHTDPFERLKQHEVQYSNAIDQLVSGLKKPMTMPDSLHHVQISLNNCILRTIDYISRYNLYPAGVAEKINSLFHSQDGIQFLARLSMNIFRIDTKFHNAYNFRPFEEVHIKNHFQLHEYSRLYQDLSKREQDWWLFQLLAARMNKREERAILEDDISPKGFFQPTRELIKFLIELKKFLLNELENSKPHAWTKFLVERKADLLIMVNFVTEPTPEAGMRLFDLKIIVGNTFATLDFIMNRFGFGYKENKLLVPYKKEVIEFREKMKLLRQVTDVFIWNMMTFDYNYYISKFEDEDHKIPRNVKKVTKDYYWRNLMKKISSYRRTRNDQMEKYPDWREKMQKNDYYKHIIDVYDEKCQYLEIQYNIFETSKDL